MKSEKGITLIALIVTITIMTMITLTVFYTAKGIDKEVNDDVLLAELETVHQIVLQEYNKKLTLEEDYIYVGEELTNITTYNSELGNKLSTSNTYYKLSINELKQLGAKNVSSTYIVCYETGEVANITKYKTSDGKVLYTK